MNIKTVLTATIILFFACFGLTGCKETAYDTDSRAPFRFVLNAENIELWQEVVPRGVYIELTVDGKEKLYLITGEKGLKKPVEIYVGDTLIQSLTIEEPALIRSFYITMDEEKFGEVRPLLPADKYAADE